MTETIAPPDRKADPPLDRRQERPRHVRAAAARSGTRPPASRAGRSTSRLPRRSTPPSRPRRRRSPPGAHVSLARRAELFFTIRAALPRAPRGHRALPHARARQGHLRRARRGRARPRGDRVRMRHPDPPQGRVLRAGLDRDRRLLDPPAARRRRRDHAVQLPRDGAHVDVGARDRVRQHVRAQAVREGSLGVGLHGRAAQGGRAAGRRLQRHPRRQGRGRRAARAPGRRRGQLRRLDADRALRLRDGDARTASARRRSAGRRTT